LISANIAIRLRRLRSIEEKRSLNLSFIFERFTIFKLHKKLFIDYYANVQRVESAEKAGKSMQVKWRDVE